MDISRTTFWFAIVLISGMTFLSGPLVGQVNFTEPLSTPTSEYCEPSGNATLNVDGLDTASLAFEQRRFGDDTYAISGGRADVSVTSVWGCPVLVYRMEIPELDFFSQRLAFLSEATGKNVSVRPITGNIAPSSIDDRQYNVELTLLLRGDQQRIVHTENATIGPKK